MRHGIRVREATEQEATACHQFIQDHPGGSLFHTWEWLRATVEGLPHRTKPCYLVAYQGTEIAGILPAIVEELYNQAILRTLPWGRWVRSALLSTSWSASEGLLNAFLERCSHHDVVAAEVLLPSGEELAYLASKANKPTRRVMRFTQVVGLPSRYEQQWVEVYNKKTRNILRKARRQVSLRRASNESQLPAYYQLYKHTMSFTENANHLYPESLLGSLWRHFAPDHLEMITAYHEDVLIGGAIFLYWRSDVYYWSAAGLRQYRPLNATSLFIDDAIQRAIAQGYRRLNMGSSITYGGGLYRFKAQFGARYADCDTTVILFKPAELREALPRTHMCHHAVEMADNQALIPDLEDGVSRQSLLTLTPRRRISLGARQLPDKDAWLVYAIDGAEERRLAAGIQKRGLGVQPEDFHGRLLRMNDVALKIWECCDGTVPLIEIAEEISRSFHIQQDKALADVISFVHALAEQDLVDLTWTPL